MEIINDFLTWFSFKSYFTKPIGIIAKCDIKIFKNFFLWQNKKKNYDKKGSKLMIPNPREGEQNTI